MGGFCSQLCREDSHTGSQSPKRQKIIGVDIDPQLEACFFFSRGKGKQQKKNRGETTTTFFFCVVVVVVGSFDLDVEKKNVFFLEARQ